MLGGFRKLLFSYFRQTITKINYFIDLYNKFGIITGCINKQGMLKVQRYSVIFSKEYSSKYKT